MTTSTFTFPVSPSANPSAFLHHLVTYRHTPQAGMVRKGFIMRTTPNNDPDYTNAFIVVTPDEGHISYVPISTMEILEMHDGIPSAIVHQVAVLAWEKRNQYRYTTDLQNQVTHKQIELDGWEEKVRLACEKADEEGYCSQFQEIAEAAGFDIPEKEEFEIECEVTIRVTISKEAFSEAKAKEMVERDDISSAISGEDSIESWELVD